MRLKHEATVINSKQVRLMVPDLRQVDEDQGVASEAGGLGTATDESGFRIPRR